MNKTAKNNLLIILGFCLAVSIIYSVSVIAMFSLLNNNHSSSINPNLDDTEGTINLAYPSGYGFPDYNKEDMQVLIELKEIPVSKRIGSLSNSIKVMQDEVEEKLSKKPEFRLSKSMNGIIVNISQEEYNRLSEDKNVKKIYKLGSRHISMDNARAITSVSEVWNQVNSSGSNITGVGVVVAVLDTGIDYTHPFFGTCNNDSFIAGTCDRFLYGYDFYNGDNDPFDDNGHGTHVSGIIGGLDPTGAYTGNAPNVTFVEYKVCSSSGSCHDDDILQAIENATALGVDIIHMSLGAAIYIDDDPFYDSLLSAYNSGILIVASAGNNGQGYNTIDCPSCIPFVISVGSTSNSDTISSFSSRGIAFYSNGSFGAIKPDLLAPGQSITSSVPNGTCAHCNVDGVEVLSGTSMSAPQVSGIIALLIQAYPSWSKEDIKSALTTTSKDLGYNIRTQGSGRVDAIKSYNSSIVVIPYNYFAKSNFDLSSNYSDNFTVIIKGLLRNDTFNISFLNYSGYILSPNITSFTADTSSNLSIIINITRFNNGSMVNFTSMQVILNSSVESYTIPVDIFSTSNDINCPVPPLIITENYTMKSGLNCVYDDNPDSGLIVINGNNTVFDCNGSTLHGKKAFGEYAYAFDYDDYAIYSYNTINVTVKNCIIENFNTGIAIGGNNVHIINNTMTNVSDYVRILTHFGYLIEDNQFLDNDFDGILITNANNTVIRNNVFNSTFFAITTTGGSLYRVNNLSIYNNIINYNRDYSDYPYYSADGFLLDDINGLTCYNNTFNKGAYTFNLELSKNLDISNITINNAVNGVRIEPHSYSLPVANITFKNIYIDVNTSAIYSDWMAYDVKFYDVIIVNATNVIESYKDSNIRLINVTYNGNTESINDNASIRREWYALTNVKSSGANLQGANVTVYENSSGSWIDVDSSLTDAGGLSNLKVIQYWRNSSDTIFYSINLSASKDLYYPNSTIYFNISDNFDASLNLYTTEDEETSGGITITDLYNYPNPFVTSNSSMLFGYNISTDFMNNLTWSWDNTNFTIYDDSLILDLQMNNYSALGEWFNSTGCLIADTSRYGNNGSCVGNPNITLGTDRFGNLGAMNFSGGVGYISTDFNVNNTLKNSNFTISLWVYSKLGTTNTRFYDADSGGGDRFYLAHNTPTNLLMALSSWNTAYANSITLNQWENYVVVLNGTTGYLYRNGNLIASQTGIAINLPSSNLVIGAVDTKNAYYLNGSIDNFIIFNRSLTPNEISQSYKSSLTKYNSQNWSFYSNQSLTNISLLNSTNPTDIFPYSLCSSNSTTQVCTASQTITQTIPNKVLTANFTNSVGIIRPDFYGVNIQRYARGYSDYPLMIDTDNDHTYETFTDLEWHENGWNNAGLSYLREYVDMTTFYSSDTTFDGNLTKQITEVKWAYENNKKVLLTIYKTPLWLANKTSMCVSDNSTCPPDNYTEWNEIVLDIINRTTSGGLYVSAVDIEIGNEPEYSEWLIDLSVDNITKATEYVKLYNSSYIAIKSVYPTMQVGGGGFEMSRANIMIDTFLSNMTTNMDFISIHTYIYEPLFDDTISNYNNMIMANCTLYSANCSRIIWSEWNLGSGTSSAGILIKNQTSNENQYGMQIASGYIAGLKYPQNISMMFFQWSELSKYQSTNYVEYPERFSMVSEPQLDNTYYPPYNVTKSFATRHRAGDTIVVSTSDDTDIKIVASKSPTGDFSAITVINTGTDSVNETINVIDNRTDNLTDLEGNIYPIVNGILNLGILDSYQIKYLTAGADYTAPVGIDSGGTNPPITNLDTIHTAEICSDTKAFLSSNAVQGRVFNEIPSADITQFITQEADKFKLPESMIHNFMYSYPLKCGEQYPQPAWLWLRNNWVFLGIIILIIFVVFQGIKRMK